MNKRGWWNSQEGRVIQKFDGKWCICPPGLPFLTVAARFDIIGHS